MEPGSWIVSATNNFNFSHPDWSVPSQGSLLKIQDPFDLQLQKITSEKERHQSIALLESTLLTVSHVLTSIQSMESSLREQLSLLTFPGADQRRSITAGGAEGHHHHHDGDEVEEMSDLEEAASNPLMQQVLADLRLSLESPDPHTGQVKIKIRLSHDEHTGDDEEKQEASVEVVISEDRVVRIFISSPFTDMQEERDLMVKRVFPKLRKLCDERDVNLSYVDLRW